MSKVYEYVIKPVSNAISKVSSFAGKMVDAGVDFVRGFINGIGKMIGKAVHAAENLGKSALNGVKKFLHIGSPSKVMRQYGVWTVAGFTNGINATAKYSAQAMTDMARGIQTAVDKNPISMNPIDQSKFSLTTPDFASNMAKASATMRSNFDVNQNINLAAQPLNIDLNVNGRAYHAFVEDISNEQAKTASLQLKY